MQPKSSSPERLVIAIHPKLAAEAAVIAADLTVHLEQAGRSVVSGSIYDEVLRQQVNSGAFDILIALGGDGTMLRAGHLCAPADIPVLGINVGRFGFLCELQRENWHDALSLLLEGKFWLEHRMMLAAQLWHQDTPTCQWDVLNDVVVCRGQFVRPVTLTARVDEHLLARYVADGLIAATPTGSTAYALAVGGPILPPEMRNILIVPVAPHLSMDRAIILPEGASVSIEVHADHQAVISADGQAPVEMDNGDHVVVTVNQHSLKFIRFSDPGYFYRNLTAYMEHNPLTGAVP
jgi:NAD+ kinase